MIQGGESFRLVVRRGPQPNQAYELKKDVVTLGRDITNDITINDPEVSRHHLRFMRGGGGFTVEDLGSTNGTFINGQRVTAPRLLRPGDMVGLGETVTLAYEPAGTMPGAMPSTAPDYGAAPSGAPSYQPAPIQPNYQPPAPGGYPPAAQRPPSHQPPAPGFQPPSGSAAPGQPGVYGQPPTPGYGQPPTPGAYGQPPTPGAYGSGGTLGAAPMPPQSPLTGYAGDYDPYAAREDEPNNTLRWVLIGCGAVSLLCCCTAVIGLVAVDSLCLWDNLGPVYTFLRALGFSSTC